MSNLATKKNLLHRHTALCTSTACGLMAFMRATQQTYKKKAFAALWLLDQVLSASNSFLIFCFFYRWCLHNAGGLETKECILIHPLSLLSLLFTCVAAVTWRTCWSILGRCRRAFHGHASIRGQSRAPGGHLRGMGWRREVCLAQAARRGGVLGLGSVNREHTDSNTLDMVSAGLQLSLRMSKQISPDPEMLQW